MEKIKRVGNFFFTASYCLKIAVHRTCYRRPGTPRNPLVRFTIPGQPIMVELVNSKTTLIDIPYLDNKNCGALYIVPVTDDLVHPETTPTNIQYLDTENYGALYIEPVTDKLVNPNTNLIDIPYQDNKNYGALYQRSGAPRDHLVRFTICNSWRLAILLLSKSEKLQFSALKKLIERATCIRQFQQ